MAAISSLTNRESTALQRGISNHRSFLDRHDMFHEQASDNNFTISKVVTHLTFAYDQFKILSEYLGQTLESAENFVPEEWYHRNGERAPTYQELHNVRRAQIQMIQKCYDIDLVVLDALKENNGPHRIIIWRILREINMICKRAVEQLIYPDNPFERDNQSRNAAPLVARPRAPSRYLSLSRGGKIRKKNKKTKNRKVRRSNTRKKH